MLELHGMYRKWTILCEGTYNTTNKEYSILESTLGPYLWKPRMEFPEFFLVLQRDPV